jgi:1-aminocyclopropane-1-carboxylate deaminase
MDYLTYKQTPIIEIIEPFITAAGVRLLVKLEYRNHEEVTGNKWWKLKYNLLDAKAKGLKVVTFGGAYSNHIYATAAAARILGLECVGIIRGEDVVPRNQTLTSAAGNGMQLKFLQRSDYRRKHEPEILEKVTREFGNFCLIPEGGTNILALKGVEEFASLLKSHEAQIVVTPVGTAGTVSGLTVGLPEKKIIGVPVLKQSEFLGDEIIKLQSLYIGGPSINWKLLPGYHFGGYAKVTKELLDFIRHMEVTHKLPLDPVYTGKMMYAIYDQIAKGSFKRGDTILALHTGGLQGASSLLTET